MIQHHLLSHFFRKDKNMAQEACKKRQIRPNSDTSEQSESPKLSE